MNTYARPNLVAALFNNLTETISPLLDQLDPPALTDPGIEDLLTALSDAATAALRATREADTLAPAPIRPAAAVRAPAARVTVAQVGSVAGAVKPGSLRAKLIGYLAEHPGEQFTVTQLTHATEATSGGAVGAALNTMAAHGEAIQVSDMPKRYAAPAGTTAPAPAPVPAGPDADTHDDLDQDTAPGADEDTAAAETAAPEPEASTDPDTTDEPDVDQPPTPEANDEQAAPEDAPAPARATRRAKTRR